MRISRAAFPVAALLLAACESATSPGGAGDVRIRMGSHAAAPASAGPGSAAAAAGDGPLVVDGTNGQLSITDLRVVVAEFELKGDDDLNPCADSIAGDDCDDFNAGPLFIDVPLNSSATIASGTIPPGTYRELEFEIEDLDDDEEDPAEAARIQALFAQIRAEIPDWPRDASMMVAGTFTPRSNGALGTPVAFRVFIEAEVEKELELAPPLVVGSGDAPRDITVEFDPTQVFRSGTQVVNLAQFNGQLVRWRIEDGFREDHSGRN